MCINLFFIRFVTDLWIQVFHVFLLLLLFYFFFVLFFVYTLILISSSSLLYIIYIIMRFVTLITPHRLQNCIHVVDTHKISVDWPIWMFNHIYSRSTRLITICVFFFPLQFCFLPAKNAMNKRQYQFVCNMCVLSSYLFIILHLVWMFPLQVQGKFK